MPLGEEPITSYFPRLRKGKRKSPVDTSRISTRTGVSNAEPATKPSRKRSRISTSDSLSSVSSETLPPVWDIFNTRAHLAKMSRSVISLDDDSDSDQQIKSAAGPSSVPSEGCTSDSFASNATKKARTPNHERLRRRNQPVSVSPIASTSDTTRMPDHAATTVSNPVKDCSRDRRRFSGETEAEIPSSQPFERHDEYLALSPSASDSCISKTSSILGYSSRPFPPHNGSDTEIELVDSSQTQNILLHYVSPRRTRILKPSIVSNALQMSVVNVDRSEDIVRSSQSQFELGFSQWQSSQKPSSYKEKGPKPPSRTYSDGLFSAPRRDASLTEEFVQEKPSQTPTQEDSETEPDTEDEAGKATEKIISGQSSDTQTEGGESYASYNNFSSLPSVVKEFQDMFGSDGSQAGVTFGFDTA